MELNMDIVSKMSDDELYAHVEGINNRLKQSIDANFGVDVGVPPLSTKEHFDMWDMLIQLVIYIESRKRKKNENAEP